MARNAVKCYEFCMGKFIWTRNLMMRSDFKNHSFLRSFVTSQNPKKGCKSGIKWRETNFVCAQTTKKIVSFISKHFGTFTSVSHLLVGLNVAKIGKFQPKFDFPLLYLHFVP